MGIPHAYHYRLPDFQRCLGIGNSISKMDDIKLIYHRLLNRLPLPLRLISESALACFPGDKLYCLW